MGTTADWDLPYPESTDPPEVWSDIQFLADVLDAVLTSISTKPICKLVATATQSLASSTDTTITFTAAGSEVYDDNNWHNFTTNTGRITPNVAGKFQATGHLFMDLAGVGITYTILGLAFFKNNTIVNPRHRGGAPTATNVSGSVGHATKVDMNGSTDFLEMAGYQLASTSASKSTIAGGSFTSSFELEYLG
jgi:hypothetical protein